MRKSQQILELEARFGKPLTAIVTDAYTEHGTIEAAANAIGVKPNTFAYWVVRLGVRTRKVASVA